MTPKALLHGAKDAMFGEVGNYFSLRAWRLGAKNFVEVVQLNILSGLIGPDMGGPYSDGAGGASAFAVVDGPCAAGGEASAVGGAASLEPFSRAILRVNRFSLLIFLRTLSP